MEVGVSTGVIRKNILRKMKYSGLILLLCFLASCQDTPSKNVMTDTPVSGTINISVDESFQPVISEQVKVFEAIHPKAKIIAHYKSEADCLRDFQKDSTRLIIISRELNHEEIKFYKNTLKFDPPFDRVAYDAIAVVVNKANPDSVFTYQEIKGMIGGTSAKNYNVVVDGKNATSTVRYLIDSVLKGGTLGMNVTAAKNSEEVITYVSNTPNAIGFVGVSWMMDREEEGNVKTALIECKKCDKDTYAKPSQQTITFKQYPLVRGLYYVLKENYTGLGTGLINFLSQERGQLIFKRASLVPTKINLYKRSTKINESE
jgi:phosphate transport system substrate-binding protein